MVALGLGGDLFGPELRDTVGPMRDEVGRIPTSLAIADFDSDGRLDVVVGDEGDPGAMLADPGGVVVLLNQGKGAFAAGPPQAAGANPRALAATDCSKAAV